MNYRPAGFLRYCLTLRAKVFLWLIFVSIARFALGQTLEVLHLFQNSDGALVQAGLVQGTNGDLYGATEAGGDLSLNSGRGFGTLFKITTNGSLTTLVRFNGTNGSFPDATLVRGRDENLYGVTSQGGDVSLNSGRGFGTVFQMTPAGALTTLFRFNNRNGANPQALVEGSDGAFYGTAYGVNVFAFGGTNYGSIFKITTNGVLTTLYWFKGGSDGRHPEAAGLVRGSDGNFYGASGGGVLNRGTLFRITSSGEFTTLVTFNGSNGDTPYTTLIEGRDGSFYGTTASGGTFGGGTVFKVTPAGALTTLVSFNIPPNQFGVGPWAGLVLASDGSFYGTTHGGADKGTVFRMTPSGGLTTIVQFNGTNGGTPEAALVQGSDGHLYGTTYEGGIPSSNRPDGLGTVFRVVMPVARPSLPPLRVYRTDDALVITWPASESGAILETKNAFIPGASWAVAQPAPVVIGDQNVVTISPTNDSTFYRLRRD